ncbi:MAG: DsbA family protein, partial [Methanomicrobiales archaeon]|nr:DsbA family protein [Methanomicrobiales archaeon]
SDLEQCGNQTLTYVNQMLASQGTVATLESVSEVKGMYQVNVTHRGGVIPLYVTRDCSFVFSQQGWEIGAPMSAPTANACGERTVTFVNEYLTGGGTAVTLANVLERHGMYQVNITYEGEQFPLYATVDCSLLFNIMGDGLDMSVPPPTPTPTPEPVKTDRPTVDLYVMSFCPYGTQAEGTLKPVVDLLGEKADFRIRYITTVTGTNLSSVRSLHGAVEAEEDLRQICIQKQAPGNFWTYLARFNAECYPLGLDQAGIAECSRNITSSLGIDEKKVTACVTGTGGIDLLKTDEGASEEHNATASPTLIVNGVEYGGDRTPEAYKQAVCRSFTNPPAECATVLSSQTVTATGSC